MTRHLHSPVLKWALVALALLPALNWAYMGYFGRLFGDDFWYLRNGFELGPLEGALAYIGLWRGHYSAPFLLGLIAPLKEYVPATVQVATVVLWVLALWLLLSRFPKTVSSIRFDFPLNLSVAALIVGCSIQAFYTTQSFHWMMACIHYTFSLVLFLSWLAVVVAVFPQIGKHKGLAVFALVGAACCFVSAGFGEVYLIFQLMFLSILLALLALFMPKAERLKGLALIGAGWLGTLASLAVQYSSPGAGYRAELIRRYIQFQPMTHVPDLVAFGLLDMHFMLVQPNVVVSTALMFALGILVSQRARQALDPSPVHSPFVLRAGRLPYCLGLVTQLAFVGLLWSHRSDDAQFLGRFSLGYLLVVGANVTLLLCFLFWIWRYRQISNYLRRVPVRMPIFLSCLILGALALFAAPELRSIHISAHNLLFATALSFLLIAWWEWTSTLSDPAARRLSLMALAYSVLALFSVAALIGVPRLFVGIGAPRHWSSAAFVIVTQGFVWGIAIGVGLRRQGERAPAGLVRAAALLIAIAYVVILSAQLEKIPHFALYASEWDKRHALLLEAKARGEREAFVPPSAISFPSFILAGRVQPETNIADDVCRHYRLEAIWLSTQVGLGCSFEASDIPSSVDIWVKAEP